MEAYRSMEICYQGLFDTLKRKGILQKTMREDLNLSGSIMTRLKHNGAVTTETVGIKFDSTIIASYNNKQKAKLEQQIAELQKQLKEI